MTNPTRADLEQLKQRIEDASERTRLARTGIPLPSHVMAEMNGKIALHRMNLAHVEDHIGSLHIAQTIGSTERTRYGLEIMAQHTARLMVHYGGE